MSLECRECEQDLRGGHAPGCPLDPDNIVNVGTPGHIDHGKESSDLPVYSIAWSSEPPTDKGMYLWRQDVGLMLAIVYTMTIPDSGKLIGKVYGHGERHFYEACPVEDWGGQWLGPLPQQ